LYHRNSSIDVYLYITVYTITVGFQECYLELDRKIITVPAGFQVCNS
jgi:hypothetical protein